MLRWRNSYGSIFNRYASWSMACSEANENDRSSGDRSHPPFKYCRAGQLMVHDAQVRSGVNPPAVLAALTPCAAAPGHSAAGFPYA